MGGIMVSSGYESWSGMDVGSQQFIVIYIFIRPKAASKQTNNHINRQIDRRQKKNRKTMLYCP